MRETVVECNGEVNAKERGVDASAQRLVILLRQRARQQSLLSKATIAYRTCARGIQQAMYTFTTVSTPNKAQRLFKPHFVPCESRFALLQFCSLQHCESPAFCAAPKSLSYEYRADGLRGTAITLKGIAAKPHCSANREGRWESKSPKENYSGVNIQNRRVIVSDWNGHFNDLSRVYDSAKVEGKEE